MRRPIVLALFSLSAVVACGPSGASICKDRCDCESTHGCSSAQGTYILCKTKAISDEQASELLGCSKQFDDLIECRAATFACIAGIGFTECDIQENLWNKCMTEAQK